MKRFFSVSVSSFAACAAVVFFATCTRIAPEPPKRTELDSTLQAPVSIVNVPVFYPVKQLEDMANEKLDNKIIEARLPISKGNDSLFLSVSRFKPIELEYDGDHGLTYRLPVEITGFVDSRVAGIKIKNKTPVHAKVIISMFSDIHLDNRWDLVTNTKMNDLKWIEEPKLNVAGIKFNLKSPIEKALEKSQDKIVAKLDSSTAQLVKIRQSISKLWVDIQKPIRINKKVVPVWLKGYGEDMDGRLVPMSKDTLMIQADLYARLQTVFDSAGSIVKIKPLPRLKRKENVVSGLNAYVHIALPFNMLNSLVNSITDTMTFKFKDHAVRIASSEVYGTPEGIAIRISTKGDLKADLYLRGTIGFDSVSRKVEVQNFGFDINTEQSLVNAADWFAHDELIERIKPYLSIPLQATFDAIPDLIVKGIEKGKLGQKIDLHFSKLDVNIYQYLVTRNDIQLIVSARGQADVMLQKALFSKKKKADKV